MSGVKQTDSKIKKWQDPSKFSIEMTGAGHHFIGSPSAEDLSMACQGVQLAELTMKPIEDYIGEEWRFAHGRLENYQISITFKDYNNFTLYKNFANGMQKMTREFPDDCKIDVKVSSTDNFLINDFEDVVTFKDCMLIAVGGATLDNSAVASIAEFSVTFKASYVETGV